MGPCSEDRPLVSMGHDGPMLRRHAQKVHKPIIMGSLVFLLSASLVRTVDRGQPRHHHPAHRFRGHRAPTHRPPTRSGRRWRKHRRGPGAERSSLRNLRRSMFTKRRPAGRQAGRGGQARAGERCALEATVQGRGHSVPRLCSTAGGECWGNEGRLERRAVWALLIARLKVPVLTNHGSALWP